MKFLLISPFAWNAVITALLVAILFVLMVRSRNYQKFKSKFLKDSINEVDKFNKIIHSAPFALNTYLVLNSDNKIVGANERTQKMFGWKEEELWGKEVDKIFSQKDLAAFEGYKIAHQNDDTTIEVEGITRTGEKLVLDVYVGKWPDHNSWYCTVIIRDISHRKRNEEAIRLAYQEIASLRELYHEGEKIGNVAFWKLDVRSGKLHPLSPNFAHLFGVNGSEFKVENLVKRVFEGDKITVANAMNTAKENKTGYDIEYRMHGWDDYINTIHSMVRAYKNDQGEITHFIGMARMVKKEKQKWV